MLPSKIVFENDRAIKAKTLNKEILVSRKHTLLVLITVRYSAIQKL